MASGVSEISFRCCASSATFLFTPLFLLNVPESNPKPEEQITTPPAIRNTSILMPKKFKITFPIKNEITKMIKTFIEAHKAVLFLDSLLSSWVRPKKIGTDPNGLITENKAAKVIKNKSIFKIEFFSKAKKLFQIRLK